MTFGSVLVTGGAGFLGARLVRKLLPLADHIYVIDDLSTGNRGALPDSKRLTFYGNSITDQRVLEEVLPKVEWVFHLACSNLVQSAVDLWKDFDTNLYGGVLLLEKCLECCPRIRRFVYTSTASVYGNADTIPTPETCYSTTLPYAASKFSMEHYCHVFFHMHNLPVTILRLSNVFGPGQLTSNPYCGVVAKFFEAIRREEPLTIYGDGTQTRDFTFVEDALEAVVKAAFSEQAIGQVYNVGTGMEVSVAKLAETVLRVVGLPASYPIRYERKRTVDTVQRRALDSSKLRRELSWQIGHSLQEGLMKTYLWLKEGQNR